MSIKDLGQRLKHARAAHRVPMRHFEKPPFEIPSATICRIEQGKPVDYDTGKKIEQWLSAAGEPKPCDLCDGRGFHLIKKGNKP